MDRYRVNWLSACRGAVKYGFDRRPEWIFSVADRHYRGKCLFTTLVSMIPIIELRGGHPLRRGPGPALLAGLSRRGNRERDPRPLHYRVHPPHLRLDAQTSARLNSMVDKLEEKAHLKGQKVRRYQYLGLWIFVAIPLPGTGAWTGSLVAAFLNMRLKQALPAVVLGVMTAGCIMTALTHVGINLFA